MGWWQGFLDFITSFELWQLVLGFLAAAIVGIIIGICIGYLVYRFVYKVRLSFLSVSFLLFGKIPKTIAPKYKALHFSKIAIDKIPRKTQVAQKQVEFAMPELIPELVYNRTIASEFSAGILLPLQTDVWDAHQYSVHQLPANLRSELEKVYADIKLLNNLVWISTELGHSSSNMEDQYRKLLISIGEGIDKINKL